MLEGLLRTAPAFAVLCAQALVAIVVGYPWARLSGSPAPLYRLARAGLALALRLAGVRLEVEGRDRLGEARNLLLVANHASHLDGPLLLLALGVDFTVLLKRQLHAPPLRPLLRTAGFIPVDRADRISATGALEAATAALTGGRCLLVFPEGTRSRDGRLGELRKGAFAAAIAAGSRVAAVAIQGTHERMPPGRAWIRPGPVRVRLLDVIDARGQDRDALTARVQAALAGALAAG